MYQFAIINSRRNTFVDGPATNRRVGGSRGVRPGNSNEAIGTDGTDAPPPRPAPLPVYQREFSGSRYPDAERQHALRSEKYRHQPREAVIREQFNQRAVSRTAPPAGRTAPAERADPAERATPSGQSRDRAQGAAPAQKAEPPAKGAQ